MSDIERVRQHLRARYQDKYVDQEMMTTIFGIDINNLQEKEEFLCVIYMMQEFYESKISCLQTDNRMQKMFAETKKL